MDDDSEINDDEFFDYDHKFFDRSPFPDECQNEVVGIESFYLCFTRRYSACPVFFMGSLHEACQEAFSSPVIKEHRPVLVYIHNDKKIIIEYLLENYIVWPWDITFESNRNRLIQIWEEMFSIQFLDILSVKSCPMLIGIMRRSAGEKGWSLISEYEFKLLFKDNTLIRIQEKSGRETFLRELIIFKEECDDNEQLLSSDFITKTGLCLDIILDIAKYLTLNDAVKTFSDKILILLRKYKTKVHISYSSDTFIKMILRKIDPEQIVSLRLNPIRLRSMILSPLLNFTNVISLILLDLQTMNQIKACEAYFPNLTSLSLWTNNEIDFNIFSRELNQLRSSIRRFEIRCAEIRCTHSFIYHSNKAYTPNLTIENFLFDVSHATLPSINDCLEHYKSCFLTTTIDLIKYMANIRYVHLIINKWNFKQLLHFKEWTRLVNECRQLKKITLKVMGNIEQDQELIEDIVKIQKDLYNVRQSIKFQVIFV
ncbi:unnamed protein product [Rotaria sordida]|uniref:UAS domain-containing protein n=1 Tax=Rotaria sordida TaxID=392033 RepID=A0A815GWX1_9BILA|nr:unnamed protein product [Rotaria sordida]CAF1343828.1 unnamed protein product [Rotaria sordida]CAF3551923.1 unnamed protein product [Rotaria sordida]CAF3687736.1 unnamed protein product [Rotaria sordida]